MEIKKLENYKVNENSVFNETDKKHVENYMQLIKFFESALSQSIVDGKVNYNALHSSCIQSIRYLDNLILTYDNSVQGVRLLNKTIDKIIEENKDEKSQGNDQEYRSPL
jgi:hypothetical protein